MKNYMVFFESVEIYRYFSGDPTGNRTPIAGLKIRCPNR